LFSETFLSELEAQPITMIIAAVIGYIVYLLMGAKSSKNTRKKRSKQVGIISAAVIVAVAVLISSSVAGKLVTPHDDKLHAVFVDVGQGLGSYISINEQADIFDCGGSKGAGEAINESLWEHGIKEIDYIVISHLHDDHANGISEIFAEWEIDEVIVPYTEGDPSILVELMMLAAEEGAEVVTISEDLHRNFGEAKIKILYAKNKNMVVKITLNGKEIIFTGNMTDEISKEILQSGQSLKCDIVQIANHGYNDCGVFEFYEKTGAEIGVWNTSEYAYRFFNKTEGYEKSEVSTRVYNLESFKKHYFCDRILPQIIPLL
jgi:competence protein ComEC